MPFPPFFSLWKDAPGLLLGVFALLGTFFALYPHWIIILLTILLFCTFNLNRFFLFGLVSFLFFFFYAEHPQTHDESSGKGIVEVTNIQDKKGKFGASLLVKGRLLEWNDESCQLDVSIHVKKRQKRMLLLASQFSISGDLKKSKGDSYYLKGELLPVESPLSFAIYKYKIKSLIKAKIETWYPKSTHNELLTGLLLGDKPSAYLQNFFNRYGLQHLLAISGFHFCMLSWMVGLFLRRILPRALSFWALLLTMAFYTCLIDPSPSVFRAFVTFLLLQGQEIFSRESISFNRLGIALVAVLLYDPCFALKLGFQFSFLVTASLLLLYPMLDEFLENYAPKQIGPIRNLLSLSIAVHTVSLPLSLFWFGYYPALGVLYNLFFPFLITITLSLFFIGIALPPVHTLNAGLIDWYLHTFTLPTSLDLYIKFDGLNLEWTVAYIAILFLTALAFFDPESKRERELLEYY